MSENKKKSLKEAESIVELTEEEAVKIAGGNGAYGEARTVPKFHTGQVIRMPGFEHRFDQGIILERTQLYDEVNGWDYLVNLHDVTTKKWEENHVNEKSMPPA